MFTPTQADWELRQLPDPYHAQLGAPGVPTYGRAGSSSFLISTDENCRRRATTGRGRSTPDAVISGLFACECGPCDDTARQQRPVFSKALFPAQQLVRLLDVGHACNSIRAHAGLTVWNLPAVYGVRRVYDAIRRSEPTFWAYAPGVSASNPLADWSHRVVRNLVARGLGENPWATERATGRYAERILGHVPTMPQAPGPGTRWVFVTDTGVGNPLQIPLSMRTVPPAVARAATALPAAPTLHDWRDHDVDGAATALLLAAHVGHPLADTAAVLIPDRYAGHFTQALTVPAHPGDDAGMLAAVWRIASQVPTREHAEQVAEAYRVAAA